MGNENDIKQMVDQIKDMKLDISELEKLSEDDKTFILLRTAMVYYNGMNSIEAVIREMESLVRTLVPETVDILKIILSRLEDINPNEIDNLSAGFIENIFTIDGKPVKVTLPEVGEFDNLEYKRFVIRQIKVCDEQVAVCVEYAKEVKAKYEAEIPEYVRKMVGNMVATDEWVTNYLIKKSNDPDMSDAMREEFKEKLKYREYAFTLEPIIKSITDQIERRTDGSESIRKGFFMNKERVLNAAVNISSKCNFSFPFNMMNDLDKKLFPEGTYDEKYKNLFIYLLARYIKYRSEAITDKEKIFFTNLCSNLVILNRPGAIEKYPELADKMRKSIGKCMDLVVPATK
jgi:hypothetical protein